MGENNDDFSLFFPLFPKFPYKGILGATFIFSGAHHSFSSNSIDETDKNSYNKGNW